MAHLSVFRSAGLFVEWLPEVPSKLPERAVDYLSETELKAGSTIRRLIERLKLVRNTEVSPTFVA